MRFGRVEFILWTLIEEGGKFQRNILHTAVIVSIFISVYVITTEFTSKRLGVLRKIVQHSILFPSRI